MSAPQPAAAVDLEDIQGLLRFGYKRHVDTAFLLLRVHDQVAARAWLAQAPVANAKDVDPPPQTVLQVALTSAGLRALGVPASIVDAFSNEFVTGMGSDANQARRLGDVEANDPAGWHWGVGEHVPHVLAMLYAMPGRLPDWHRRITTECAAGFEVIATLIGSSDVNSREPFGFADGLSQPELDWKRQRPPRDETRGEYGNLCCLGEFLLGYPNEYGGYTDRPLLDPANDPQQLLPPAEEISGQVDLGRNGSYLVMRQLEQGVAGFWQWLNGQAGGNPARRESLAAAMVGRTLKGEPLAERDGGDLNAFTFDADPDGARCPIGAHIRRSNPRSADLPPGNNHGLSWLLRTLGLDAAARQEDQVASARFHRILRRGRKYGPAPSGVPSEEKSGLYFIALNASLSRQFEFIQSAWIASAHFNGLSGESDPLLGTRQCDAAGRSTDCFSIPQADGPDRRLAGLPQFVTVRGGAYFFMPGIRALRYIATAAQVKAPGMSVPLPSRGRAGALSLAVHEFFVSLLHAERRIDPFFRPAFDKLLREPLTALVQSLTLLQRREVDEVLGQETLLPGEAEFVDAIATEMNAYLRSHYRPGGFERGGNTKTHGIVRAQLVVRDDIAAECRHGVFAERRSYPAWVRFAGPGPASPPDIEDVGVLSIGVKLMEVPGPKLLDDERWTQDFTGISTPIFTTPDVRANAALQAMVSRGTPLYYFLNGRLLDGLMQGLWSRTQTSPLETAYWGCVPYRLGERAVMQYSFRPRPGAGVSRVPNLPRRPPDNYLREAMAATLGTRDVELDMVVQIQADARRMPIENASVRWPERLSPALPVATLVIPRQVFDTPAQLAFARRLSINPWHCIAQHQPLGNQNRARLRIYQELSRLRQSMNGTPHVEPDGKEVF